MIKVDLTDNGLIIAVYYDGPTKEEIRNFKTPTRVQLREGLVYNQIFFTIKVGDENWMDAPYSPFKSIWLLVAGKNQIEAAVASGNGIPARIIFACERGIVSDQNYMSSPQFAKSFLEDVRYVVSTGESIATHDLVVDQVYSTMTTKQLVQRLNRNRCDLKSMVVPLRKSQTGIQGIRKKEYPGLSDELERFHYYYPDCGHVIMAIPETLFPEAEKSGEFYEYEVPFPVRYVLEKGYRKHNGFLICDGEYSNEIGLMVPEKYTEW